MGISAWQTLVWGFFFSTVCLYHITFSINSIAHIFGSQFYNTYDNSRNNLWLALLSMGEGWHNNHHYYPNSERQGFLWWQIDLTHIILKFLSFFKIIWAIKSPPKSILTLKSNE